jgi:hypothetical protein
MGGCLMGVEQGGQHPVGFSVAGPRWVGDRVRDHPHREVLAPLAPLVIRGAQLSQD